VSSSAAVQVGKPTQHQYLLRTAWIALNVVLSVAPTAREAIGPPEHPLGSSVIVTLVCITPVLVGYEVINYTFQYSNSIVVGIILIRSVFGNRNIKRSTNRNSYCYHHRLSGLKDPVTYGRIWSSTN
jgi:hypothetical protein